MHCLNTLIVSACILICRAEGMDTSCRGRKAYDTADGRADEGECNPCADRPDGIGGSRREFFDTASDGARGSLDKMDKITYNKIS